MRGGREGVEKRRWETMGVEQNGGLKKHLRKTEKDNEWRKEGSLRRNKNARGICRKKSI